MTAWKVDKAIGNVKNDTAERMSPASRDEFNGRESPRLF